VPKAQHPAVQLHSSHVQEILLTRMRMTVMRIVKKKKKKKRRRRMNTAV
jgi:hypothetical protein